MKENIRTANIATGVSVCIIFLYILLLAVYLYRYNFHLRYVDGVYDAQRCDNGVG